MADNDKDVSSVLLDIAGKFILVLSKTKDAVLNDLINEIGKDKLYEGNKLNEQKFIVQLLKRLGYDLESAQFQGLASPFITVFNSATALADAIKPLLEAIPALAALPSQLTSGGEANGSNANVDPAELAKQAQTLYSSVKTLVDAIKQIEQTNWNSEIAQFMRDSGFNEDFVKRFFDHCIVVFLQQAVAVFSPVAKEQLTSLIGMLTDVARKTEITQYLDHLDEDPRKVIDTVVEKLTPLLTQAAAKQELEKIVQLKKAGIYFECIYAVFDFLKIIHTEAVESLQSKGGTDNMQQVILTSIHVIHWERVEKLATDPLNYCKEHFPVTNYTEAEALIDRLIKLVRVFNPDLLDFHSMQSMVGYLFSLLMKHIKEAAAKATDNDLFDTLMGLLAALKQMIDDLKAKLASQINTAYTDARSLLREMVREVNKEAGAVASSAYTELKNGLRLPVLNDSTMRTILAKSLLPLLVEKAQYLDKCKDISRDEWEKFLQTTVRNFQATTDKIVADITSFLTNSLDIDSFIAKLKADLEKEFSKQTQQIPTTPEAFNAWLHNPTNPFDFNINAYVDILMKHIRQVSLPDPEKYYADLKNCALNAYAGFIKTAEGQQSQLKKAALTPDEWKQLANHFFAAAWEEIRKQLIDPMLNPFIQLIERKISAIARNLINQVIQTVNAGNLSEEHIAFAKALFTIVYKISTGAYKSFADYVGLADELYKAIPERVRKKISNESFSFNLPPYKFNAAEKFIAVTLYDDKNIQGSNVNLKVDLAAFIEKRNGVDGVRLIPVVKGDFSKVFSLGAIHTLKLALSAALNTTGDDLKSAEQLSTGTIGLFISKNGVELSSETKKTSGAIDLSFQRKEGQKSLEVIKSPYFDFTIADYPQTISTGYKAEKFIFTYKGEIKEARIKLKVGQINDFLATIIKDDIEFMLNLALIYDLEKGLSFEGKPSLKFELNIDKTIGALKIGTLAFELGSLPGAGDKTFAVKVTTSFAVNFSGVVFALKGLGARLDMNYLKKDGSIGDFAISPNFEFPTGIALSIDSSAVKGTGILTYDKEKEEFMGALEIMIVDQIKVGAIAILSMRMPDGSKGFSFMTLISVYFTPGIQIGMGFSLTGLGGTIGIHRRINNDMLLVGVREGTITNVFFVEDLDKNLDKMMIQIPQFFPVQKDQFFFGILARITYAEFIHICIGLLVQLPKPTQILIVGGIFINLPTKEEALLKLNVYFSGGIDFDQGIWFDASIVNSSIVGFEIYGDMALRLFWGGPKKGFLYSAGGFHPAYTPDAAFNLGKMRRLGMGIQEGLLSIKLESYFAITSNTVQFGADLSLAIAWGKFGLFGYFGFDCLFQFKPFYFMFDVRAGVAVKAWGKKICSVQLKMSLQGPGPWRAKGTASIEILFFSVDVDFELEWGQKQQTVQKRFIDIYPKLAAEYRKVENWNIIPSRKSDDLVKILQLNDPNNTLKELVMQPYDGIQFDQPVVPLNKSINRFGEEKPLDFFKIELEEMRIGSLHYTAGSYTAVETDFAPTLFIEMNDSNKLKAPSYEKMQNGAKLMNGMSDCVISTACHCDSDYDTMQDELCFSNDCFRVTETLSAYKAVDHLYPVDFSAMTQNPKLNKVLIFNAYSASRGIKVIRKTFTFQNQLARRSDVSFRRHVKKLQQPRATGVSGKIAAIHALVSQEDGFRINSKVDIGTFGELEKVGRRGTFTSRMEIVQQLEQQHPELRNKLFVAYSKKTALNTQK